MDAFEIAGLLRQAKAEGRAWLEFFRAAAMSLGIYCLPAGGTDTQQPHTEDEAYYVLRGRARFRAGAEDRAVEPGTVLFVAAKVEHRFHSIAEDLVLLVVFAPAEGMNRTP
jgi:mannose-6-phosphate isomerase-like protein (cupin superfamily)